MGMLGGSGFKKKEPEEKPEVDVVIESDDEGDYASQGQTEAIKALFRAMKSGDHKAGVEALNAFNDCKGAEAPKTEE